MNTGAVTVKSRVVPPIGLLVTSLELAYLTVDRLNETAPTAGGCPLKCKMDGDYLPGSHCVKHSVLPAAVMSSPPAGGPPLMLEVAKKSAVTSVDLVPCDANRTESSAVPTAAATSVRSEGPGSY